MSDTTVSEPLPLPTPIAGPEPCGPDLEAAFDPDFMNLVAKLQGELPASYLGYAYPSSEEDRVVIDFQAVFRELGAVTTRTHDLRLLSLQARFQILQGNLQAIGETLLLMAGLVDGYWDEVHPRAEGGTMDLRRNELAALDAPVVMFAMQYAPVCENRRVGVICVRSFMYAQGKAKPREGEKAESERTLAEAIQAADEDEIGPAREGVDNALAAVARIRAKWAASDDDTPPLDKLHDALAGVRALIEIGKPATATATATETAGAETDAPGAAAMPVAGAIATHAAAAAALQALAGYFARAEPSSPALPLIDQAVALRGKSFFQAIKALLPKQAEQASFKIGGHAIFDLSLSAAESSKSDRPESDEKGEDGAGPPRVIGSRREAIGVMGEVTAFYKRNEPSSPVPWLLERASGLADRDFMSLLGDVLPKAALRDADKG